MIDTLDLLKKNHQHVKNPDMCKLALNMGIKVYECALNNKGVLMRLTDNTKEMFYEKKFFSDVLIVNKNMNYESQRFVISMLLSKYIFDRENNFEKCSDAFSYEEICKNKEIIKYSLQLLIPDKYFRRLMRFNKRLEDKQIEKKATKKYDAPIETIKTKIKIYRKEEMK